MLREESVGLTAPDLLNSVFKFSYWTPKNLEVLTWKNLVTGLLGIWKNLITELLGIWKNLDLIGTPDEITN
ncbi:hypothetical protein RhiirB3_441931 [Rhizophagus irregularis]|nr:hypothetical protein RhiirB3_441931 [Rhizophagus irregularis]